MCHWIMAEDFLIMYGLCRVRVPLLAQAYSKITEASIKMWLYSVFLLLLP
jgi:hypothetical protein